MRFLYLLLIVTILLQSCRTQDNGRVKTIDERVDSLVSVMTLDEKVGQTVLNGYGWDVSGPVMRETNMKDILDGKIGNLFNAYTAEFNLKLQKEVMEKSRLKIPLLFGYDVIHGHKTIFPIPLGEASSWDIPAIEKASRIAAKEAAANGLHWVLAPMVDICRDPRWGRVTEGAGEDTYLACEIAKARVKGFQGDDLSKRNTVLACVKHFAAYGASQAGRDYHTVDMSERVLREVYLPPYKAAIDAGALSVMASFNEYDGVPAHGSSFLLKDILRNEWGFKGFVVSDYTGTNEMVNHGVVEDTKGAAELAFNSGVEMEIQGNTYFDYLKDLVLEGKVKEEQLDYAVKNILKMKFKLGLFDDPFQYCDTIYEKETLYAPEHLETAHDMACKSMVLLKNESNVLPLSKDKKIALIGPLADSQDDMLGSWSAAGEAHIIPSIKSAVSTFTGRDVLYAKGCNVDDADQSGFDAAMKVAKKSDVVVMVLGESRFMSGEAASRTSLDLPGVQTELLEEVSKLGKPIVLVLLNGRPLTIGKEVELSDAVLEAWYPGTAGGKSVVDILYGERIPSGKLTITFPQNVGQIPIHYNMKNTGRPLYSQPPGFKYTSRYIDCSNDPLFPFGYGLSYTKFEYSDLQLSHSVIGSRDTLKVSVQIKNIGDYDGDEIVQLYIRDLVGSVTRPVKELKGFKKVFLKTGESKIVNFYLSANDLSFYRKDMSWGFEKGDFDVFVGTNSNDCKSAKFKLN
ncbi:glycosyl hydrolase [Labilibacter sediminis]|nr:glycosyl hydrolase [Labilibacter sediminis]